jgi:ATP-dependent DNA helicase RecQ
MFRLADGDGCRHERMVGHFGEVVDPCGDACDRCTGDDVLASAPKVAVRRARAPERAGGGRRRAVSRDDGGPESAEVDLELFEALRAWRGEIARARSVPAYVVFSDATLLELALARPLTREAMLEVKGVGPKKLAEYGEALLAILRR